MICDSHTHSVYSFDGHSTIEAMCESAISRGVDAFVLTEHHDIDGVMDGFYADYDAVGARQAIDAARRKYGDRVLVYRGIEIGEPGLRPSEAKAFLERNQFEFVIASCHNLENVPDFYFFDFTWMPEPLMIDLYRRMIRDLTRYAAFPGIHTVAHLTYPLRYMAKAGRNISIESFEAEFRRLFRVIRENGAALELNMKGIRTGGVREETEKYLLSLYRDCGGTDVTIGSDAHRAEEVGGSISEGYALLRDVGFTQIRFPGVNGMRYISIQPEKEVNYAGNDR